MLLLIPSPLLGPAVWRPVESWLRSQGHQTQVVDLGQGSRTPAEVVASITVAAASVSAPVVLVPHSNAGLYAPHPLATIVDPQATVYVDAALPHLAPGDTDTALAPPRFHDFLSTLADAEGLLPPWTHWWNDVGDLFPDEASRAAVEREQPRLPLAYFSHRLPVPADWTERPAAYLAFGDTYDDERRLAAEAGWPTRTIDGGHLHPLRDPAAVGTALVQLSRAAVT